MQFHLEDWVSNTLNVLNFACIKFRDFREFVKVRFFASIKFRESACIDHFTCTNFREFINFYVSKKGFGTYGTEKCLISRLFLFFYNFSRVFNSSISKYFARI